MTVVIPYASSGPKKANLNEIVFAEGDLTMMTANYSTSMWVKHKVNFSTMGLGLSADTREPKFNPKYSSGSGAFWGSHFV